MYTVPKISSFSLKYIIFFRKNPIIQIFDYRNGVGSQLIRIIGVLLYKYTFRERKKSNERENKKTLITHAAQCSQSHMLQANDV